MKTLSGGCRLAAAVLLVSVFGSMSASAAGHAIAITSVASLTNVPQLQAVKVVTTPAGPGLAVTAEFMNDCLAVAGLRLEYFDLASPSLPTIRVLLLRQQPTPQGCPDIFAPVTSRVVGAFRDELPVEQIAFLDHRSGSEPLLLVPAEVVGNEAAADLSIEELYEKVFFPTLTAEFVSGASGPALRLAAMLPVGCNINDVTADVVEGRSTLEGREVSPIPLWIIVKVSSGAHCTTNAQLESVDLILSLQNLVLQGRQIRLVNYSSKWPASALRAFSKVSVN
jgi:hypothetical protein